MDGWPWSVRKVGIHHRYDQKSASSTWFILQPTPDIRSLPASIASTPIKSSLRLFIAHDFILRSVSQTWDAYLQDLDANVRQESREARLDSSLDISGPKMDFDLGFAKVQDLQHQQELIHDAILVFQSQSTVIQSIRWLVDRAANHSRTVKENLFLTNIDRNVHACASQVNLRHDWAKDVLERAKKTAELITAFLNSKHTHALISNNLNLANLAEASRQDGQNMLAISRSMKKDSATMKLFAVIAVVYVPGTFVATLFSTGFVNVSLGGSDIASRHQSFIQAGIYTSVTVILTLITLFVPSLLSRRNSVP